MQLPDLTNISNYSFGMIGLVAAFMVGHQFMEKFRHLQYATTAGIVSICVLMMTLHPIGEKQGVYDLGRVGPTGILIGVLFGVAIGVIFHFYSKLNFLKNSSLPDFVANWINNIIPIFISLALFATLIFAFKIDVFQVILNLFEPIQNFGQSLPGLILLGFDSCLFLLYGYLNLVMDSFAEPYLHCRHRGKRFGG